MNPRARARSASRRAFCSCLAVILAIPATALAEPSDTLDVLVFPDGHFQIGDRRVTEPELEAAARELVQRVGPDRARAAIAADRRVVYSLVIAVMDVLHRAGLQNISMLVAPEGS